MLITFYDLNPGSDVTVSVVSAPPPKNPPYLKTQIPWYLALYKKNASNFLVQFEFVPQDTVQSEFFVLVDFGGEAFSVEFFRDSVMRDNGKT